MHAVTKDAELTYLLTQSEIVTLPARLPWRLTTSKASSSFAFVIS